MLAKLVYNQSGVCTPTTPFPDGAIGRRLNSSVRRLGFLRGDVREKGSWVIIVANLMLYVARNPKRLIYLRVTPRCNS